VLLVRQDRCGLVTGGVDGGDDLTGVGILRSGEAHRSALRGEANHCALHAGHGLDRFGHMARTVVAGHPGHAQFQSGRGAGWLLVVV